MSYITSLTLSLLGQRIAHERLHQNLTQLALAKRSGVAYSTLRKIETTGMGAMGDYAEILFALGQLEQLAAWASAGRLAHDASVAGQRADGIKRRRRARSQGAEAPAAVATSPALGDATGHATGTATAERKSTRLGLDFPYDWSNPAISDEALIGKVLDRARFMDVSKIIAHYGHERVAQVAADLSIDLNAGVLGALMPGIYQGAQRVSNA